MTHKTTTKDSMKVSDKPASLRVPASLRDAEAKPQPVTGASTRRPEPRTTD